MRRGSCVRHRAGGRRIGSAVLILTTAVGCSDRSWTEGTASCSAALTGEGLHDELRSLRVLVFDLQEQGCVGHRVERPGLAPLATTGLVLSDTPQIMLDVPAGPRTIYVEVYRDLEGLDQFGSGCAEAVLSAGEERTLQIRVVTEVADADGDADGDGDGEAGDADVLEDGGDLPGEVVSPSALVISELDYDQGSSDTLEFVELYNPGATPVPCAGLELWFVSGTSGTPARYHRQPLGCATIGGGSFHVVGSSALLATLTCGSTEVLRSGLADLIQDGPADAVALIDASSGGAAPVDELAYDGLVPDWGEGPAAPADDSASGSLQRNPPGRDTDDNAADFSVRGPTPCRAP